MAVQEQTPIIVYVANGTTTQFAIPFDLHDPADLLVLVNNEVTAGGSYSVVDGAVIFGAAPADGSMITLYRDTKLDRSTNYKTYDNSFRPESVNWDFDKLWHALQEQNLIDSKILARIKEEIEWRRTHDFNYDELAQVREQQLFDALKGYADTLYSATNPNVFAGVIAGVVFARDGKSIQTHIEEILDNLSVSREDIESKANQTYVDEQLSTKAPQATTYTKTEVDNALSLKAPQSSTYTKAEVDTTFAAYVGGRKAYTTLALAQAAQSSLPANTAIEVTNDGANNGTYQWNGTTLTKSAYDPVEQAKASDKKSTNITMKTITVSGDTSVQLSDVENNKYLVFTGNLLSNAIITFPDVLAEFTVQNATTGGFSLRLTTEGSTYTQELKSREILEIVTTSTEVRVKGNLKASLESPVFTGAPKAPTPNALPNDSVANVQFVKRAAHGALEIAVTGDMTLTDDQMLYKNLIFVGSLSSDATIQIASAGQWNVRNVTTGGFSLNIKSVGQIAPVEVVIPTDLNTYHINSTGGATRFVLTKSQTKGNKSISLTGLTDLNITVDDALRYESFYLGGTLTQDVTVVFPKQAGSWIVRHQASGGFRIYVKTLDSTISPIQLSNADNVQVVSDGINLHKVGGSGGGSATLIENYRGVHVLGNSYSVGDILEHGSGIYRCVVAQSNVVSPQDNGAFRKIQHNALSGTNTKIATKSVTMQNHTGIKTVIGQSNDGMTWFSGDNWNGLFESKDFGATWTMVKNFGNGKVNIARQLGNGEMLCDFADQDFTPFKRQIWVSSGYGTSNVTWTKVLETQVENVHFNDSWGFHDYNNIVLLADYGNKYMPEGGGTVIEGENSRYAYMSTDYGKTFTQIFDLNDYTDGIGVHLHGIVYDQYWNRIWLSHGDGYYGNNGLWYSDDLGKTWQSALETSGAGRNFTQSVGIVCLPTCILFASDSSPNGIQRLDRAQGKTPVRGYYTIDGAYIIPDSSPDSLNYLCKSFSQARFIPDAPVIFSFAPEVLSGKSTIIATYNGWEFFELWTDDEVRPTAKGLNRVVGVTRQNEIICRSNDDRYGTGTATRLILSV